MHIGALDGIALYYAYSDPGKDCFQKKFRPEMNELAGFAFSPDQYEYL